LRNRPTSGSPPWRRSRPASRVVGQHVVEPCDPGARGIERRSTATPSRPWSTTTARSGREADPGRRQPVERGARSRARSRSCAVVGAQHVDQR
jgi:hypothetical protein